MKRCIKKLYPDTYEKVYKDIQKLIEEYKTNDIKKPLTQADSMIITYGDSIIEDGVNPLVTLNNFLQNELKDTINTVHILPMFPYTSDDGFSVVDYLQINPELGTWKDVNDLSKNYKLMFDAVVNHISKSSTWFKEYSTGNKKYENFFIECDPNNDYSKVVRPRSLPLYYKYPTSEGEKYLWATFSEDQLDINYENPKVLLEVLKVLLEYANNGANFIRLDAIGFLWKKENSTCIHLDETHTAIKIMRSVLETCYPNTRVITETNVPHKENISYFGNGHDEAHMVYQFPLPPLTLFSFIGGNSKHLTTWAKSLDDTPLTEETTYFNFLASHDGIGVRPTEGILSDEERQLMVEHTLNHNGRIGYKNNPDGTKSPYELNINYLSALYDETKSLEMNTRKYIGAHMILLSLRGVPGIYIHSLLGSKNDIKGMTDSNINRRINRKKLQLLELQDELNNPNNIRRMILQEFKNLLTIRKMHSAFKPHSRQTVLSLDDRVFSLIRHDEKDNILCLINVSNEEVFLDTDYSGFNIIDNHRINNKIHLSPYQYMWIKLGE